MLVVLDFADQAESLQVFHNAGATFESVEPNVLPRRRIHPAIEADYLANLEPMPLSDVKILRVVSRCYLDNSGSKFRVDGRIGDHLYSDLPLDGRNGKDAVDIVSISFVARMNRQSSIAELRLGAYCGESQWTVFDVVQLAFLSSYSTSGRRAPSYSEGTTE